MTSTPEAVYASTDDGILYIVDDKATFWNVAQKAGTDFYTGFSVHRSSLAPNILFMGKRNGLDVLTHSPEDPEAWSLLGSIPGITNQVNTMTELHPGQLVLGMENGVIHVTYDESTALQPEVSRLDTSHGLPVGSVSGFIAAGTQWYASLDGLYTFDDQSDSFTRVDRLFPGIPYPRPCNLMGVSWKVRMGSCGSLRREGMHHATPTPTDIYTVNSAPFLQASDWTIIASQLDPSGVVWLVGVDGLVRFDPTVSKSYDLAPPPLISRITIATDSLVAGGEGAPAADHYPSNLAIAHKENSIRFDYLSPLYDQSDLVRYQSKLDGYDARWSAFSSDISRTYTNLPGGAVYLFGAYSKCIWGN